MVLSIKVALFNLNVALFGLLWGTATGLGMQWTLGAINIFFLWVFGVPVTYYTALVHGGGLGSVWTWINAPYTCMNLSLIVIFMFKDWQKVQAKIRERDEDETPTSVDFEAQQKRANGVLENERLGLLNGGKNKNPMDRYGGADQ